MHRWNMTKNIKSYYQKGHITSILISEMHEKNGHAGQRELLSIVREEYWSIRSKDIIKKITHTCVNCFQSNPVSIQQVMRIYLEIV